MQKRDDANDAFIVLKLLVWVYTATLIGTVLLHSFDSLDVTHFMLYVVPSLLVPALAMDATFKFDTGLRVAITLILLIVCIEIAGLLYAIILAAVDGNDFLPFQSSETVAFVLLLGLAIVRVATALAICSFLDKLRSSSYTERFGLGRKRTVQ